MSSAHASHVINEINTPRNFIKANRLKGKVLDGTLRPPSLKARAKPHSVSPRPGY